MKKSNSVLALGTVMSLSFAASPALVKAGDLFQAKELPHGYVVAKEDTMDKDNQDTKEAKDTKDKKETKGEKEDQKKKEDKGKEGNCGEGTCGGMK